MSVTVHEGSQCAHYANCPVLILSYLRFLVHSASLLQIIFKRREYMMAAMCAFCFLLSLPHLSKGGSYLTEIVDVSLFRLLFVIILLAIPPLAIAYGK